MENLIRQLYFGEYNAAALQKPTTEQYQRMYAKASEVNQKIVDELKRKGVEDAEELAEEWVNAWFAFTNEELADSFKKGIKFGVEFTKELDE